LAPPRFGYQLARDIRRKLGLGSHPIDSLESISKELLGPLEVRDHNHIPGKGIRAVVGQSATGEIITAGPQPTRPDNRRFLTARSLFQALTTSRGYERLVTDAFSWDQKASRAFAAELLAPQQALVSRISGWVADQQTVDQLSREFQASTIVIEKQLDNCGITLAYE